MTEQLTRAGVDVLSEGFAEGTLSPVEVTEAVLARTEELADLRAFVLVDAARALEQARASEQRWHDGTARGPLDGVPATIKDLSLVTGWPTRKGAAWLKRVDALDTAGVKRPGGGASDAWR